MVRPLAIAGFTLLAGSFLSTYLPSVAILPLAVILLVLIAICLFLKCKYYRHIVLISATIIFSVFWFNIYTALFITPHQKLVATTHNITAIITQTESSYIPFRVSAVLKIQEIDGVKVNSFSVACDNLQEGDIGNIIKTRLTFNEIENPNIKRNYLADNIVLQAQCDFDIEYIGVSNSVFIKFVKLQHRASAILKNNFSSENATILSAILTGDQTDLSRQTKQNFRMAGLSHTLVVSGLHLSIIILFINMLLGGFFKTEKLPAIISLAILPIYALFTGLTPSVVRAAVVIVFVLLGKIFLFGEDTITSMAAALILILLYCPYACLDIGLLLSFSAAGGIVLASHIIVKYNSSIKEKWHYKLIKGLITPVAAIIATLPVQIYIGSNISIVSVFANIFAVPLLSPILVFGFVALAVLTMGFLSPLKIIVVPVLSFLVSILNFIAKTFASISFTNIPLIGMYPIVVCSVVFVAGFVLYRFKKYKSMLIVTTTMFAFSIIVGFCFNYNTIKISAIGTAKNPSIIISQNNKANIIYKGRETNLQYINEYLLQNNITDVQMVIDITGKDNTDIIKQSLNAKDIYIPNSFYNTKTVFRDILINIRKQKSSTLCIIDIKGYTVAVINGKTNFENIPKINIYFASSSISQNMQCETIVSHYGTPNWINTIDADTVLLWQNGSYIWIRPEKAVKIIKT